jgi:hypothetical protein
MAARSRRAVPAQSPAPVPSPHHGQVQSIYQAAQITPGQFKPDAGKQVTKTVGVNPDAPAHRQQAPPADGSVTYAGGSPTGYDPFTLGTI